MNIYMIVEGDGDQKAAPALVRRLLGEQFARYEFTVSAESTNGRDNILKENGLEKALNRIRRYADCKGVIVLLDAERTHCNCPPQLANSLAVRAKALGPPFSVVVICARCEYESWFLTSLHTIKERWLKPGTVFEGDPEQRYGVKEWLSRNMRPDELGRMRVYKETEHQEKMTFALDIQHTIEHSRSFRRMAHAIEELLNAIANNVTVITPMQETDLE